MTFASAAGGARGLDAVRAPAASLAAAPAATLLSGVMRVAARGMPEVPQLAPDREASRTSAEIVSILLSTHRMNRGFLDLQMYDSSAWGADMHSDALVG